MTHPLCPKTERERDEALARALEAERERDELRTMLTRAQDAAIARNERETGDMFAVSSVRFKQEEQRAEAAESHLARLEEALRKLIEEAASMDRQIDGEWGVPGAPYEEDEAITKARAALTHSTPPSVDTREDNPNDWPDP